MPFPRDNAHNPPQLGAAARARLRDVHRRMQSLPNGEQLHNGGRALADFLRGVLPDLDDATIGRVTLEVGVFVGVFAARSDDDPRLTQVGNQIVAAGLGLTAAEWDESLP